MRLRITKEHWFPYHQPWRVLVLTPAGWTRVIGASFATWSEALDYVFGGRP